MDNEKYIKSPIFFDKNIEGKRSVYFDVKGEPFAKQRPRAARKGNYITIYTPKETKQYEDKVLKSYKKIYRYQEPLEGDLSVNIEGIFSIPKSLPKHKQESIRRGEVPHTKKPDCDNMGKICLDALNGVVYADDAQINNLAINKKYGDNAKIRILIYENKKKGEI